MAEAARFFGHLAVSLGYLDRLVERVGSEIIRMPKTVGGLCVVFADEIMRRVAIVAGRDRMMARLLPAVVLLIHYVAVGTRRWIIAQVGITLRVNERVHADAGGQTDGNSHDREFEHL